MPGPGAILGLRELLLGEKPSEDIMAARVPVTLWRIPEKAFRAAARQHPDLSLLLFQTCFGDLGLLTDALKVCFGRCYHASLSG